jgi:hypothetical protein
MASMRSNVPATRRVAQANNATFEERPWLNPKYTSLAGTGTTPAIDPKYATQNTALIQALGGEMAPGTSMGIGADLQKRFDLPAGYQAVRPAYGKFIDPGSALASQLAQGAPGQRSIGTPNPAYGGAFTQRGWWQEPGEAELTPGANGGVNVGTTGEGVQGTFISYDPRTGYIASGRDAAYNPKAYTWPGGKPPTGYTQPRLYGPGGF